MAKIKSLIICTSPLQMMIAERIIALHPNEDFECLIRQKSKGKHKYYGDRLISKCGSGTYWENPLWRHIPLFLRMFYTIFWSLIYVFKHRKVNKVYVSSWEAIFMRLLISGLPARTEIHSFDDGLMNLLPKTYESYKSDEAMGVLGKLFKLTKILQNSEIQARLKNHYTIYSLPNSAHPDPIKINLFKDFSTEDGLNTKLEATLFLGQPVYESRKDGNEQNKRVSEKIVSELDSQFYLPHPREDYKVDGVEYIDTPLIAEDYLLQELEKHPERRYTVYSYFSTTLMNLKDHPRIKMVACRPASVPERWQESYELLERIGIEIREFPNL